MSALSRLDRTGFTFDALPAKEPAHSVLVVRNLLSGKSVCRIKAVVQRDGSFTFPRQGSRSESRRVHVGTSRNIEEV